MGYYIEVPSNKNKAQQIVASYDGEIIQGAPISFQHIPQGKAAICVVDNGAFEAALFCYDKEELAVAKDTREDPRQRTWLLIDWDKACKLTRFNR